LLQYLSNLAQMLIGPKRCNGNGGTCQICQKSLICIVSFSSKLISKCCIFSIDGDRVKSLSALVTRYLKIDLRSFLPPSNHQTIGGTSPFCHLLDVPFLIGAAFNIISQTKHSVSGLIMGIFLLFEASKNGMKSRQNTHIWG
jgi:hypothetical protein